MSGVQAAAMNMDDDYAQLVEELPHLYRARALLESLSSLQLFARVGERLSEQDKSLARSYVDGLGFPEAEPALLLHWNEALSVAESQDNDPYAWETEEQLRLGLAEQAVAHTSEEAVQMMGSAAVSYIAELAKAQVMDILPHHLLEDEVQNALVGHATRAAHGAMLAVLAGADEPEDGDPPHPLITLFALFRAGRWPVGLMGQTFNIF